MDLHQPVGSEGVELPFLVFDILQDNGAVCPELGSG